MNKRKENKMFKRFSVGLLILAAVIFLVSCGGSTTPPLPKPRATVNIAVSPDPPQFSWIIWDGGYVSVFQIILSETKGVAVTITTVKAEFLIGSAVVFTYTAAGGALPANGTLLYNCRPVVAYDFTEMKISCIGVDANGYEVNKSRSWFYTTGNTGGVKK